MRMRSNLKINTLTLVCVSVFGYGVYNLFEPDRFPLRFVRGDAIQLDERVSLGPYPSQREFHRLRRMGVTTFVSLMSPDFPVEAPLIRQEENLCNQVGVTCRNFPMNFSDVDSAANVEQADAVIAFLKSQPGKIYVHCYLGRHRIKLIQQRWIPPRTEPGRDVPAATRFPMTRRAAVAWSQLDVPRAR